MCMPCMNSRSSGCAAAAAFSFCGSLCTGMSSAAVAMGRSSAAADMAMALAVCGVAVQLELYD